jgi:hypothetical protein
MKFFLFQICVKSGAHCEIPTTTTTTTTMTSTTTPTTTTEAPFIDKPECESGRSPSPTAVQEYRHHCRKLWRCKKGEDNVWKRQLCICPENEAFNVIPTQNLIFSKN